MAKHPVPKQKQSKARSNRRYKIFQKSVQEKLSRVAALSPCPNCKAIRVQHRVCGECGTYKGKDILGKVKATVTKAKITTVKAD